MKKITITVAAVLLSMATFGQESTTQPEKKEAPKGKPIITIFSNFHAGFGDAKDDIGFELERAYLGYQYEFNSNISAKVVFDMGKSGSVSDLERLVYVKNALLTWKTGNFTLNAGLTGLEQFNLQEKFWGHRYVMKSFQDEYKFGSSADLGVVGMYKFADWISADLTIVNGEGYKKVQVDNQLLYGGGITLKPIESLTLRVYGDYKGKQNADSTETGQENLALFAGYQHKYFSIGAEYNMLFNSKNKTDKNQSGVSAYASVKLPKNFEVFGRWDYLASNNDWNQAKDGQMMLIGLQYAPTKNIKLSPNFRMWLPSDSNAKAQPFVYLNLEVKL